LLIETLFIKLDFNKDFTVSLKEFKNKLNGEESTIGTKKKRVQIKDDDEEEEEDSSQQEV
jgi:hypothetical protein